MTIAAEQYRYWIAAGLSHGEMIEALGLVPPDHPTRGDVIAALEYMGWRLATEIEMEGSDA